MKGEIIKKRTIGCYSFNRRGTIMSVPDIEYIVKLNNTNEYFTITNPKWEGEKGDIVEIDDDIIKSQVIEFKTYDLMHFVVDNKIMSPSEFNTIASDDDYWSGTTTDLLSCNRDFDCRYEYRYTAMNILQDVSIQDICGFLEIKYVPNKKIGKKKELPKPQPVDYSSLEDVFDKFKKADLEITRLRLLEDKLEEEQEKLKRFEEFSCFSDKAGELRGQIINLDKEIDKGFDDIEQILPWNIFDLIVEYKEKYDVSNPYDLVYHLTTDEIKTISG